MGCFNLEHKQITIGSTWEIWLYIYSLPNIYILILKFCDYKKSPLFWEVLVTTGGSSSANGLEEMLLHPTFLLNVLIALFSTWFPKSFNSSLQNYCGYYEYYGNMGDLLAMKPVVMLLPCITSSWLGRRVRQGTQVDANEFMCNMWICYLAICGQAQKQNLPVSLFCEQCCCLYAETAVLLLVHPA